jgi:biopolymer transport protein ExbB
LTGNWFAQGGSIMYAILAASIIALGIVIERVVYFLRTRAPLQMIVDETVCALDDGLAAARDALKSKPSVPLTRFLAAGLADGLSMDDRRRALEDAGKLEAFLYRRYLRVLSAVAQVSPLLGLFGTVLGMIDAFRTLETTAAGLVNPAELSQGIWKALLTTAFGLSVAIPTYVAYHLIASWAEHRTVELELAGDRLLESLAHGTEARK